MIITNVVTKIICMTCQGMYSTIHLIKSKFIYKHVNLTNRKDFICSQTLILYD